MLYLNFKTINEKQKYNKITILRGLVPAIYYGSKFKQFLNGNF